MNSVVGEGFKSHSQCLSLVDHFGAVCLWAGTQLQFSFLKCRMEILAGLTSLNLRMNYNKIHMSSHLRIPSLSSGSLFPQREFYPPPSQAHSSNITFQGELFPDPPLTSQSVTYSSLVACHLFTLGFPMSSLGTNLFILTQSDGNMGPFQ